MTAGENLKGAKKEITKPDEPITKPSREAPTIVPSENPTKLPNETPITPPVEPPNNFPIEQSFRSMRRYHNF